MPLYEYQCETCEHRFEKIQKFTDPPPDCCPKCGGPVRKLFSSPAIQFKGSGFYITDYAKKSSDGGQSGVRGEIGLVGETAGQEGQGRDQFREERFGIHEGRFRIRRQVRRRLLVVGRLRSGLDHQAQAVAQSARPERRPSGLPYRIVSTRSRSIDCRYSRNSLGEIRASQREVDHRLEESELVAGVVADAVHVAAVDGP